MPNLEPECTQCATLQLCTFVCPDRKMLLHHTCKMQVLTFTGQLLSKAQELQQQADQILELQRVFK